MFVNELHSPRSLYKLVDYYCCCCCCGTVVIVLKNEHSFREATMREDIYLFVTFVQTTVIECHLIHNLDRNLFC